MRISPKDPSNISKHEAVVSLALLDDLDYSLSGLTGSGVGTHVAKIWFTPSLPVAQKSAII